jgi:hypothetical protein
MLIKKHYEDVLHKFVDARNAYVENKSDWKEMCDYWNNLNIQNNHSSTSPILFYLNPPENEPISDTDLISFEIIDPVSDVEIDIEKLNKMLGDLHGKIKEFKYLGYCQKVPYTRLCALLSFPLIEFIKCIQYMDSKFKPIDYQDIENKTTAIIKARTIPYPLDKIDEKSYKPVARHKEPKEDDAIKLIKWYVEKILEIRQALAPYAKKMEKYYISQAELIGEIYELIKDPFSLALF